MQQCRRITNSVTNTNMTVQGKSLSHFLPFLIIFILKQDLTVHTLFILRVGKTMINYFLLLF